MVLGFHLGIADYQAVSWSCKSIHQLLSRNHCRRFFLSHLHLYIRQQLFDFVGLNHQLLDNLHASGGDMVIAGSSILAWANREMWMPEDVDLWIRENQDENGPPDGPLLRQLLQGEKLTDRQSSSTYPRNFAEFVLIRSRKCRPEGAKLLLDLVTVREQRKSRKNNLPWSRRITDLFDADFLHLAYTGKTLLVYNLPAIVYRTSPQRDSSCSNNPWKLARRQLRFEKYKQRGFHITQEK